MDDVIPDGTEEKTAIVGLVDGAISRPDGSFELVRIKGIENYVYAFYLLMFTIRENKNGKAQALKLKFQFPPQMITYTLTDNLRGPVLVYFLPIGMPVMLRATSGTLTVTRFDVQTGDIEGRLQVAAENYKMQAKFEVLEARG